MGVNLLFLEYWMSGVKEIGHLAPWLGDSMSPYPLSDMDRSHGTFVAGIAVYGDELEGREWVGGLPPQVLAHVSFPIHER